MSATQKGDDQLLDHFVKADDHAPELLAEQQVLSIDLLDSGQFVAGRLDRSRLLAQD
jgi:hypothetical protein